MTEEEFKRLVGFREEREGYGLRIEAGVKLYRAIRIPEREIIIDVDKVRLAKERLTEELIRLVYEDRRKELHDALMDVRRAHPYSTEFHEAMDKAMRLAKRQ